jgi:hypothetical protein
MCEIHEQHVFNILDPHGNDTIIAFISHLIYDRRLEMKAIIMFSLYICML